MDKVKHRKQTDEETYQMLKRKKDKDLMDAEQWKRLRLKQLKKEGKKWSK